MILGLVSDTHDNLRSFDAVLSVFREREVGHVLHAGDITSPQTLRRLRGWAAVAVLGNNDIRRTELLDEASSAGITLVEQWEGSLGGLQVALLHGDDRKGLTHTIASGHFDLVVTGHSHRLRVERVGCTLVVNPGALQRAALHTCVVYDSLTGAVEVLNIRRPLIVPTLQHRSNVPKRTCEDPECVDWMYQDSDPRSGGGCPPGATAELPAE